jgi:hypothetical protein
VITRRGLRNKGSDAFLALMKQAPCDKVLISSEFFCAARDEWLERFKSLVREALLDVEFIYVVRNPLDHAFSMWTQNIKDGKDYRDWREFLRGYVVPFGQVIHRYRKHMGDSLHVLNYDDRKGSLLKAVCDIAGVTPDTSGQDIVVNRSPTRSEAELLLYVNRLLADAKIAPKDRKRVSQEMYRQMVLKPAPDRMRPMVTGDDLNVLERNNAEPLAYVNRFVSGAPLELHGAEVATGQLVLEPRLPRT